MTDLPIRPAFWNVPLWGEIGVYVLGIAAVALLVAGIVRNLRLWLRGAEEPHPVKDKKARLLAVLADVFTQRKSARPAPDAFTPSSPGDSFSSFAAPPSRRSTGTSAITYSTPSSFRAAFTSATSSCSTAPASPS